MSDGRIPAVSATAAPEKVLILDSTVTSGATSEEANKDAALGYTVDVVDDATWAAMSASEFGSYRAIILGDPTCGGPGTGQIAAAEANRATWGPQVDGNVVINGTDPVYHSGQGGEALTDAGIAFATDAPGKTGMYLSLSCYSHDAPGGTPVTVLEPFGAFTTTGVGCYDDAHIVASHPALAGLTDEALSNWSCSVHEVFLTWPASGPGAFTVLAIAEGAGNAYTAPDGSSGISYVVARGEGLAAGDISLSPVSATNPVGTQHAVTALVTTGGSPLSGVVVTFTVLSGPHAGTTATATTGADGQATFSYTGTAAGTDTIQASFTKDTVTQTSNTVTKEWTGAPPNDPPVVDAGGPYSGDAGTAIALNSTASDPDSDPLTYLWSIHAGSGCTFSDPTVADPTITCTTPGTAAPDPTARASVPRPRSCEPNARGTATDASTASGSRCPTGVAAPATEP